MKTTILTVLLLAGLPLLGFAGQPALNSTIDHRSLTLKGTASGGQLILAEILGRNPRFVAVTTLPGEPAESVVQRLAQAINATKDPFGWTRWDNEPEPLRPYVSAKGPTLRILMGLRLDYFLAGSETGLGIPRPPLSLSCSYDPVKDQVILRWINPPGGYDSLVAFLKSSDYANRTQVAGTSSSLIIDRKKMPVDINDLDVRLIGFRDNVPSNAGALRAEGNSQDERYGIPFTDNVAPNWRAWLMAADKDAVQFEQGVRDRFLSSKTWNAIAHPATKPFYQLVKTKSPDAQAGVWRKFLGLTPAHTYRVAGRISTLEMDSAQGDWAFSLHAAYNAAGGADLTVAQLAGLAALPDGTAGDAAGRVAIYTPELTTKGTWGERSTGKPWRDIPIPPDITLPAGVDTITVWVRCRGAGPTAFGIDWVKLEDLSMKEPKSAGEVQ